MHNRRPPPESEQPALTIDPRYLDFGEVWETDQFEWAAPVRNETATSLRVTASGSSCSCVSPTSTSLVPPGGTTPLTFRVDLRAAQCASAEPQAVRDTKIRVALGRDSPQTEKPISVELHGRVKRAIAVPARAIDFGRFVTTTTPKLRVVPVRALVGLRGLDVNVEGGFVVAELKLLAADRWELHVAPRMPAPVSRHEAKVRLTPTTAAGEKVPPVTIPVAFDVLHDIQSDTSLVSLGVGRVGETLRGPLMVSSLSGRSFPLPTCEGAGMSVKAPSLATQQSSYTFNVERTVSAVGNRADPVVVRGRDADGHPFELRVDVQSYGLAPGRSSDE